MKGRWVRQEPKRYGNWASRVALCTCGDVVVKRHERHHRWGPNPPTPAGLPGGVWVHIDSLGNPALPAPGWEHDVVIGTIRDV